MKGAAHLGAAPFFVLSADTLRNRLPGQMHGGCGRDKNFLLKSVGKGQVPLSNTWSECSADKKFLQAPKTADESFKEIPEEAELPEDKSIKKQQHEIGRRDGHQVNHHLDPGPGVLGDAQQGIERYLDEEGGRPRDGEDPEDQPELEITFDPPFIFKSPEHKKLNAHTGALFKRILHPAKYFHLLWLQNYDFHADYPNSFHRSCCNGGPFSDDDPGFSYQTG